LRKVNDELDNFIYKTSHDIRGPLASLKGMCNVAIMDVADPVALTYLKKLDVTAEKLNTILTRLLVVNQINNSAIGTQSIDFNQVVNDVLLLEKKKGVPSRLMIRKNIQEDIEFYSDKEFIRIIFENLIDNAIKFYDKSERVDPFVLISVQAVEDEIMIKVTDNGIGITQIQPDKIFQMFSRGSDRSESGGIGLYITKTAVQKLGGTIDFTTTPERFTEFSVILPLKTASVLV
jgi:signal transduction histidine kinase